MASEKGKKDTEPEAGLRSAPAALGSGILAEQAFSRAAGAPLIPGNRVRLLQDARENYPAWLAAIASAERQIHFESYIIHDDAQGQLFARALAERARAGVRVRLIYDWLGGRSTSRRFWRDLRRAGVEVRCFNPPRPRSPFSWLARDHRKALVVDGRIGFVTGLCIGQMWVGDPDRGMEGWRDTGIELRGPAVAALARAFAQMWAETGEPLAEGELPRAADIAPGDDVAVRVVAGVPYSAGMYRLDQMIAAAARETLWLTDAYFAGTTPYVQALRSAALDGVDVRLLVPEATDLPVVRPLSRAGYRPLLEAGVRVYEWKGPMLHAKTAVADAHWARVGSTNLNLFSWIANWELDLVVEDSRFGEEMEQMFLHDLENAVEIVLTARHRLAAPGQPARERRQLRARLGPRGSRRATAGAVRLGRAVGAAIVDRRLLGPAEARVMFGAGLLLTAVSLVAMLWPRWISVPLAVIGLWAAVSLFIRALELHREGRREARALREAKPEPRRQAESIPARFE